MDSLIHTPDGKLVSRVQIPGTKVRRKTNLPYAVHGHFPVGEVRVVGEPCGKINERQDPEREFSHIPVGTSVLKGIAKAYCFHAYADTLEVAENG